MSWSKMRLIWAVALLALFALWAPARLTAQNEGGTPAPPETAPAETPPAVEPGDIGGMKPKEGLIHPFTPDVKMYLDKGSYASAIDFLWNEETEDAQKGVLNKTPGDATAWYTLIYIYLKTGEYDKAFEAVESARKNGAYNDRVQLIHGEALYMTGKIAEAQKIFEALLAAKPAFYKAALDLADLLYYSGKLDDAKRMYGSLARLNREDFALNSEVLYCIARGMERIKEYDEASITYGRAYEADPGFEEAWAARAWMFMQMCNVPTAFKLANLLLEYNGRSPLGRIILASCTMQTSNIKDPFGTAEIELKSALSRSPNNFDVLEFAIFFYTFIEDFDQAQVYLDRALKINPVSIPILSQAGFHYYLSGQKDKYAEVEKKVNELNPHCAEFYFAIGGVIDMKYGFKFAVDYCRKAIEANPDFEPAYPVLGRNLLYIGKEDEGEKMLRRAWEGMGGFDVRVKNLLTVVDYMRENFVTRESEHFIIRMDKEEMPVCGPYAECLLEEAWRELSKKFNFTPEGKTVVLMFMNSDRFSVRTAGVPGLGFALGASFGTAITAQSPSALKMQTRGGIVYMGPWAQVLYHEFTHVVTIQESGNRISRWFTEGLSELEQRLKDPSWGREESQIGDSRFVPMLMGDGLFPVMRLDQAFLSPRVLDAYFEASVMADFIKEKYGYDKIIAIIKSYAENRATAQVLQSALGMTPQQFDEAFRQWAVEKYSKFQTGAVYDADALEGLKREVQKQKNYRSPELHAQIARAYLQNKNPDKAKEYIEKALRLDPNNAEATLLKGAIALGASRIDEGIALLNKALELGAKDKTSIYGMLVNVYGPMGPKSNEAEYEKNLILLKGVFPTNPAVLYQLLRLYESKRRDDEALKTREEIVSLMDTDIEMRKALIPVYRARGENEKAALLYKEIHWIDPYLKDTHLPAASLYVKLGWDEMAAVEYEVAAILQQDLPEYLYYEAARCYVKAGKLDKAKDMVRKSLEALPDFEEAKILKDEIDKKLAASSAPASATP